jgi:GT2 family glycosyltransferase
MWNAPEGAGEYAAPARDDKRHQQVGQAHVGGVASAGRLQRIPVIDERRADEPVAEAVRKPHALLWEKVRVAQRDHRRKVKANEPVFLVHQPLHLDLATHCGPGIGVIPTLNILESLTVGDGAYPFELKLIRNEAPRGFSVNHNAAFRVSSGDYFCVLNPGVRLESNPFLGLVRLLEQADTGVVAPLVHNPEGEIEDSARRFPAPVSLLRKLFRLGHGPDYDPMPEPFEPDWVAGMLMLFRHKTYAELGGFDERYFLYCEDIDICARLRLRGMRVVLDPRVCVAHDARRASHSDLRYAFWHTRSILRFFMTPGYLGLRRQGVLQGSTALAVAGFSSPAFARDSKSGFDSQPTPYRRVAHRQLPDLTRRYPGILC